MDFHVFSDALGEKNSNNSSCSCNIQLIINLKCKLDDKYRVRKFFLITLELKAAVEREKLPGN